jgi:eukaryotic-like serine/threonine-protein kinase
VRVADFGLARRADAERAPEDRPHQATRALDELRSRANEVLESRDSLSLRLTQTGAQVGTPAYMAVEQYLGVDVDHRADQFGFCVALYEALYGQRPFTGGNLHALMFQITQGKVREPVEGRKVPKHLRKALLRGLAAKPEDRWPDMASLLHELERDPGARRRQLGLVGLAGVTLASLAAVVLLGDDPEPPAPVCTGAEQAFAETWTAADRAALEQRVEELGDSWTADALALTIPRLDLWADQWRQAWTEACEATRVHGKQSEDLLDRRMLCLERRRSRIAVLVDELAHADDELLERAPQVLEDLGELSSCADTETLMAVIPPPADPARRAEFEAIEAELDAILGRIFAGEYKQAAAALAMLDARAEATQYRPLLADLHRTRGRALEHTEGAAAAEAELALALTHALAIGDDRLAARIIKEKATNIMDIDGREHEALRWLALGRALVDRVGGEGGRSRPETTQDKRRAKPVGGAPAILASLEISRARVLRRLADYDGALEAAEAAVLHYTAAYGAEHPSVGDALHNVGVVQYDLGRYADARATLERTRDLWASEVGRDHPRTRAVLTTLGVLARTTGDTEAAERYFGEALESHRRVFGPEHVQTASALANYAVVQSDLGHFDEAAASFEQAVVALTAGYDPDNVYVGHAHANLAMARTRAGDLDRALVDVERGLAIVLAARGPEHPEVAIAYGIRGETRLARGEHEQAYADLLRNHEILLANFGPTHPRQLEAYYLLAEVERRRGRHRAALEWLERTESIAVGDTTNRGELAELEFLFAQLYAASGRDVADSLGKARRARALLVEHGRTPRLRLEEVDELIAALDG